MLSLRDYQQEAVEAVVTEARQGVRRQLVVLPTGAGKCVRGDTLILTNRGPLRIDELGKGDPGEIHPVDVTVVGRDGPERASHWYSDGLRPTIRLETAAGFVLEGTAAHRILVLGADGSIKWKYLSEIHVDDVAVIQRGQHLFPEKDVVIPLEATAASIKPHAHPLPITLPRTVTPEIARLMGYLVADGTLTVRTRMTVTKNDPAVIDDVCQIALSLGVRPKVVRWHGKACNIELHSSRLQSAFTWLGLKPVKAGEKEVPWAVRASTKPVVVSFLQALFDGDGYVEQNGRVGLTTASEALARQVQMLLLNLGMVATMHPKTVQERTYHVLSVSGPSLRVFVDTVGFGTPAKAAALERVAAKTTNPNLDVVPHIGELLHTVHFQYRERFGRYPATYRKTWESYRYSARRPSYGMLAALLDGYAGVESDEYQQLEMIAQRADFYDPIVKVAPGEAEVYDFVVPGTHSFCGNGFINHNTIVAAALSQQARGRVLMLVHRDELVQQSVEKLGYVWPEQDIGVVKSERNEYDRRVVVASVQTLQHPKRREQLDAGRFSLVIADESHHAVSPSWKAILEDLGFLPDPAPGRLLLGITATPMRGDGIGLKAVFEKVVYRRSISDLVRAGYLADVRGIRVRTKVDLSNVRMVRGDFNSKALSLAVDTPRRNDLIVETYLKHGERRRAVAFTVDVAHAQHLAEAFRAFGVRADWISGELPTEERRERLRRLRAGEVDVLTNCQILTEGWDEPSVSCLVMARPTKSTGLYIQQVGRGLRPYPGKDYCLVIDVSDNAHDICALGTLEGEGLGDRPRRRTVGGGMAVGEPKEEPDELDTDVQVTIAPLDLLARSKFRWRIERQRMVLDAGPGIEIILEQVDAELWNITLRQGRQLQALSECPLPVSYAQGVAEDYIRANQLENFASRDAAWLRRPISDAQQALLKREFGIDAPAHMTRGEAQEVIREEFKRKNLTDPNAPWRKDPASPKQISWMEARGYRVPEGFTKGDFSDMMERLKRGRVRA